MAAWNRHLENSVSPENTTAETEWMLPVDLLLEIIAGSDTRTLVRCTATCKLLRNEILSSSFINRVTQQGGIVPAWILAYLNTHDDKAPPSRPLSLVHPSTPAAMLFLDDHLSSYLSRFADDLLAEHYAVTSRNGIVLLRRRHPSKRLSNLCVYDPITGHRTFLSDPPGIFQNWTTWFDRCVLLTAEDGIDCSFLLFVPHLVTWPNRSGPSMIEVHIATSTSGSWAPVVTSHETSSFLLHNWNAMHREAVVLHGGVIHWLVRQHEKIVTYNVCTMEFGMIHFPGPVTNFKGWLHLGSHNRRKLLSFLGADGFNISAWNQLPSGEWPSKAVMIVKQEMFQSLYPDISTGRFIFTKFKFSGEGSSAVFLRMYECGSTKNRRSLLMVLDLEKKETCIQEYSTPPLVLLEVDLPSHLRAMKIFP